MNNTGIVNLGLQKIGTRTTVTDAELVANSTNEAIQANLVLTQLRDRLLRMAPWDCGMKTANLVYITSVPGTPENTSPATNLWTPGQPAPPWAYEYQYPVDCLRACWMIPGTQTGFASGVPITTAVTGGAPAFWQGPPVKFKVQIDQFVPCIAAAIATSGGLGYVVGDIVTLPYGPINEPPIGGPLQVQVATIGGGGVILTVNVVNQIAGSATPQGGSYFQVPSNPVQQFSTTGAGTGANFNLAFGTKGDQRVILTNQEYATLSYVRQVTDPNVMDPLFQDAWTTLLGSYLCNALTGDKGLANMLIAETNAIIMEARKVDGNEGLTINDVTSDWIRIRGVCFTEGYSGPYSGYDWGPLWGSF